jgi:hypothetical protein
MRPPYPTDRVQRLDSLWPVSPYRANTTGWYNVRHTTAVALSHGHVATQKDASGQSARQGQE